MFVASGHGLIAVIKPSNIAVSHGIELLSNRFVRNSMIEISLNQRIDLRFHYVSKFLWLRSSIQESFICDIDFQIALNN